MLSEVFWVAFITTVSGVVIKLASMAYKSKCSECSFCGITVKRNVELEERETEFLALNKTKLTTDQKEDV
jgi:hypothetical protein